MSRYEIAFAGELAPGASLEQVQDNLARLFQADAQRVAVLLCGRRVVIRQGLDRATAEKYRDAMARAGAIAEICEMAVEEIELAPPPGTPPTPRPPKKNGFAALVIEPRDQYMAAFVDVEAPDFGVAPLGADLQDDYTAPAPPQLDLSALSIAPPGVDLGELPRPSGAPAPDISHLKLAD